MEQKFRKVVTIFIDILGSQNRESFDEWYHVMSIFSAMIEREKELAGPFTREKLMYFQTVHISFTTIKMISKIVVKTYTY